MIKKSDKMIPEMIKNEDDKINDKQHDECNDHQNDKNNWKTFLTWPSLWLQVFHNHSWLIHHVFWRENQVTERLIYSLLSLALGIAIQFGI